MFYGLCLCLIFYCIPNVTCNSGEFNEDVCLNDFKTNKEFNLNDLRGDWYLIYFWPAIGIKEECEQFNFTQITKSEIDIDCKQKVSELPENETIVQGSYINSNTKKVDHIYFYGANEVKYKIQECKQSEGIVKGVFTDLGDGFVLAGQCAPNGKIAVLISRNLPSSFKLQSLVDSIHALKTIKGSPTCKLA